MSKKKFLPHFFLVLSIMVGGFLCFYKLNWGEGYFFHPDEYHIVGAVARLLSGGLSTNPKLFSYGSFSIYLIYLTHQAASFFLNIKNPNIFLIGRFLAALFSTLTLINIYLISRKIFMKNNTLPILSVITAVFVPGLIQQAHFSTPESFMTFWITLSSYFLILYYEKEKMLYLILSAIFLGISGGCKISAFAAFPFIILLLLFTRIKKETIKKNLQNTILFAFITLVSFLMVFPYAFIDYKNFIQTTMYESSLSLGKLMVFYTRSFNNSLPVVFQLTKIYPYTLGIFLTLFSFVGVLIASITYPKSRSKLKIGVLILLVYFYSYFFFNSFLFTKWTRFIHQTIPYLIIFAFVGVDKILQQFKNPKAKDLLLITFSTLIVFPTFLWGTMFFSIYKNKDVRSSASEWLVKNTTKDSVILTETGNTLEVPLWGTYKIIPFDFYNLDHNPILYSKLISDIGSSDYFIIQSRRIYLNHNKDEFPKVYNFYNSLFSGNLGFEEIKTFSSFPSLNVGSLRFQINDERAEETWSVFDHPVIYVFKKTKVYPLNYYDQLLGQ